MFVVRRKLPGAQRWCVILCRSVRNGAKVSQETIKYFGVAHGEEQCKALVAQANQEIEALKKKNAEQTTAPTILPATEVVTRSPGALLDNMVERYRATEGFHVILGPVFDSLALSPLLSKIRYNQLRDVVIARVAQPASKARTAKLLQNTFLRPLSEDQIYRLMDELEDLEAAVQAKVFAETQRLLGERPVDLLLFDVTTLYFESQSSDELREFGYSKDHKIGETQVVLALATTHTGSPIGYHLFQGNTAEVSTLLECLTKWKEIFDIKNVVVVADRAMMSEDNLVEMEKQNLTYVVAAKLRAMPKALKTKIVDRKDEVIQEFDGERINIQEHEYNGRRLIVQHSESRAKKDATDRDRLLIKVRKKLDASNKIDVQKLVTNRGYLKFVDKEKQGEVVLNEEKITEDKRWDGLHGVITNDKTSAALDLLKRYRNLWVIEESFRINKHTLSMRPIYHFTPRRIRAHILICYLAFAVTRYAQQRINIFDQGLSIENIRDALATIEVSILEDQTTGKHYKLPSQLGKEAKMICRAMGITRESSPVACSAQPAYKCSVI